MALIAPAYDGLPTLVERMARTTWIYAALGAYPTTIFIGVPVYFMLRRHFSARPVPCSAAGAVVAALPWLLLRLAASGGSASIGGRATMIEGEYTSFGWLMFAAWIGQIALIGAIAGFLFWAIAAAGFKESDIP